MGAFTGEEEQGGGAESEAEAEAEADADADADAETDDDDDEPAPAGAPLVLILTPVKNAVRFLPRYVRNVGALTYPHSSISLALMDSDSDDEPSDAQRAVVAALAANGSLPGFELGSARWRHTGTLYSLLALLPALRAEYRSVSVLQHNFGVSRAGNRHAEGFQLARRAALARSRNHLLSSALRDEQWVLWLDCDVAAFPHDVVQALLAARRDIVVPNVVMTPGGRSYDLNSWRVRDAALGDSASLAAVRAHHDAVHAAEVAAGRPRALHLEGYRADDAQTHVYLHSLRSRAATAAPEAARAAAAAPPPRVARLDAVGGAMLLVNAELHRHGLSFPPFVYRHRIETEGLSMMALDMGVLSYGLPDVEVIHH